ncbi:MAG: hypothetical protein AB1918_01585 [Pseudomonadota bacterium]
MFLWRNLKPAAVAGAVAHLANKKDAPATPDAKAKPVAEKK